MFTVKYYVKVVAGKQYLYQSLFHWIIKMSTFPKANHDWFLNQIITEYKCSDYFH